MALNYSKDFTDQATIVILGSEHGLGTAALRVACYSETGLRQRPAAVSVHPSTYDVVVSFGAVVSGWIVVNGGRVLPGPTGNNGYTFTSQTTVLLPNSLHQLETKALVIDVYDGQVPASSLTPGSVRVDPTTYDITLSFLQPQSGYVVLCGAGEGDALANPALPFVGQTVVTWLGTQHALGTRNLGVTVWDDQIPAAELVPGQVTVHPQSYDVTVLSLQAMSGSLALNGSTFLAAVAARVGGGTVAVGLSLNAVSIRLPAPDG